MARHLGWTSLSLSLFSIIVAVRWFSLPFDDEFGFASAPDLGLGNGEWEGGQVIDLSNLTTKTSLLGDY